jgi:hypothetical protein
MMPSTPSRGRFSFFPLLSLQRQCQRLMRLLDVIRSRRAPFSEVQTGGAVLGFAVLIGLAVAWWHPLAAHEVMMGDDLRAYEYFVVSKASFSQKVLLSAPAHKYRPVHSILMLLQFRLFAGNYPLFVWFNILVYAFVTCVLYRLLHGISEKRVLVALPLACVFLTSRFAFYHISEVQGSMELLCLLWLVLFIRGVADGVRRKRACSFYWAVVAYALLVFTHERFLAAAPALLVMPWLVGWLPVGSQCALSGMALAVVVLNVVCKKVLLGSAVLVGTGGAQLSSSMLQIAAFMWAGLFNVVGISQGPRYLSILEFGDLPNIYKATSVALAVAFVFASSLFLLASGRRAESRVAAFAATIFMGTLLLGASVTIRQELRWLAAPLIVALCWVAYSLSRLPFRWYTSGVAYLLLVLSCVNDRLYFAHRSNSYLFSSRSVADALAHATVKRWGYASKDFYVQEFENAEWIASSKLFFKPLGCPSHTTINYFTAADADRVCRSEQGCVMLALSSSRPPVFRDMMNVGASKADGDETFFDFVARFREAKTTSEKHGGFPWGETITRLGPPDHASPAIFIGGRGSIRYAVEVPEASKFFLEAEVKFLPIAEEWGVSDGAHVTGTIRTPAGVHELFTTTVRPHHGDRLRVPLEKYGGGLVEVEFSVGGESHSDITGDWIILTDAAIVRR